MRRWIFTAACVGVFCAIMPLGAQQRPISLGLAGGVSLPQGDFADGANAGWHALATIALSTLMQPLGLRLDVAYNRFELSDIDGNQSVGSATLSGTYRLPMTNSPMSPYLISGLGAYRTECSLPNGMRGGDQVWLERRTRHEAVRWLSELRRSPLPQDQAGRRQRELLPAHVGGDVLGMFVQQNAEAVQFLKSLEIGGDQCLLPRPR